MERPFPALKAKEVINDLVGVVAHDVCACSGQVRRQHNVVERRLWLVGRNWLDWVDVQG